MAFTARSWRQLLSIAPGATSWPNATKSIRRHSIPPRFRPTPPRRPSQSRHSSLPNPGGSAPSAARRPGARGAAGAAAKRGCSAGEASSGTCFGCQPIQRLLRRARRLCLGLYGGHFFENRHSFGRADVLQQHCGTNSPGPLLFQVATEIDSFNALLGPPRTTPVEKVVVYVAGITVLAQGQILPDQRTNRALAEYFDHSLAGGANRYVSHEGS